ncbi:dihydrolipoyl dehydrogenase family protein [Solicola sp. PLA-1-18]|uniref:dihydrolipoyl dehydrogenase family protein n=1 Tax=Solicola sp. PLA-1-18 TaxID=3380532 RepID=UPI003B7EA237
MTSHEVDVVVVGLGPGGEDLAARLARAGLDVVGVERRLVGGECPYWGCIPSKMVIRAADSIAETRRTPRIGGAVTVEPDFGLVATRIRDEATTNWDDTVAADRLTDSGATLVRGDARLDGPRTVVVGDDRYVARKGVVLNTGTRPARLPIDGLEGTPYWTNHEILETTTAPASLAVIGGGPIGAELAQAFSRFGTTVHVIEHGPRIVGPEEPEASAVLTEVFEREGITIHTDAETQRVEHSEADGFTIHLGDGTIRVEQLLVAAGRTSNLDDLGLETVGVEAGGKSVPVDDHMRVADGLWAIGDVAGKGAFTHVSMYQSAIAYRDIVGEDGPPADYRALPHVTFTDPEIGSVGMTEKSARDAGLRIRVGVTDLSASSRGFVHGPGNDGVIKVVEDADRGVLVGATAVGPSGGEILGALAIAVRGEVPVATLQHSIWAYPTFHRAIESALADLHDPDEEQSA